MGCQVCSHWLSSSDIPLTSELLGGKKQNREGASMGSSGTELRAGVRPSKPGMPQHFALVIEWLLNLHIQYTKFSLAGTCIPWNSLMPRMKMHYNSGLREKKSSEIPEKFRQSSVFCSSGVALPRLVTNRLLEQPTRLLKL